MLITAIVALVAGAAGGVWLKTHLDNQAAAAAAAKLEPSKYDVGPPDPQEMLELVNAERAKAGVAPLVLDENVQKSAQLKAEDMAAKDYRQHEIPGLGDMYTQEMRTLLYKDANCKSSGENIRWAPPKWQDTSRSAFEGWMSSKPHREAIQDPAYHRIGFGVKNEVSVQHFCKNK